jgi:dinuclear metal center YbgI/SA1388 family protein
MNAPAAVPLAEIVRFLNESLRLREIADYPNALNGLQLENSGTVSRLAAAVDARAATVEAAAALGAGTLLLVHHGLFWGGTQPLTGSFYRLTKTALAADLALYSAHLPLDVHPELGNNAGLCAALGFHPGTAERFFDFKGTALGLRMRLAAPISRDELIVRLEKAVAGPVRACLGGPDEVERIGIITGGAGNDARAVAAAGDIDTFITGEGAHWTHALADELGLNILYGGHYATETFGVKALAAHLGQRFGLAWEFLDYPTGL